MRTTFYYIIHETDFTVVQVVPFLVSQCVVNWLFFVCVCDRHGKNDNICHQTILLLTVANTHMRDSLEKLRTFLFTLKWLHLTVKSKHMYVHRISPMYKIGFLQLVDTSKMCFAGRNSTDMENAVKTDKNHKYSCNKKQWMYMYFKKFMLLTDQSDKASRVMFLPTKPVFAWTICKNW